MKIKEKFLLFFVRDIPKKKRLISKFWYEKNKKYKLDYMRNLYKNSERYRIGNYLNQKRRLQNPEKREQYNKYMRELMRKKLKVQNPRR